ncbi:MAG: DUF1501 domain-containing protein [Planctomyces sp.]
MRLDRRGFLQHLANGSAVLSFGGVVPLPLLVSAERTVAERILVVIELQGGNDGLNTVIPVTDPLYRRRRPTLAIPQSEVLSIADGMGFHPALRGFADLLEAGQLAVVQQVGYPQPNRSHFESMDIWHTCLRKDQQRPDGWLGRWAERVQGAGGDATALHLGPDKLPFALMSRSVRVPSVRSLEEFRLRGAEDEKFREAVQSLAETRRDEPDDLLNFVASSTASALTASERLATTAKAAATDVVWPQSGLAERLRTVSQLIRSGLQTSVYYVTLGGFDTHAQQPDAHRGLLRQLSEAVQALLSELRSSGDLQRTTVMAFSEFGRRVEENASEGTDHGTAGPMFLAGGSVRAGLHGQRPDLADLQDGDLQFSTDFREVYATILERWLKVDSVDILHQRFSALDLFTA